MKQSKYEYFAFLKACLLIFYFWGLCQSILAYKLELTDNNLKIYGIGSQNVDSVTFRADNDQRIPCRIQINELVFTYSGAGSEFKTLTIVSKKNDTIFNSSCKNGITPGEFAKGIRFYINSNEEYKFSHGNKSWPLKFKKEAVDVVQANLVDSVKSTHQKDFEGMDKVALAWWQLILIVIGSLAIVTVVLWVFIKRKEGPTIDHPDDGSKDGSDGDDPIKIEDADAVLNRLLSNTDDRNSSIDEKEKLIKERLASVENLTDEIRTLRNALGYDEGVSLHEVVESINLERTKLRKSEEGPSKEQIREEVAADFVNKILENKDNKILISLMEKSQEECKSSKYYNYDSLLRFVKLLSIEFRMRLSKKQDDTDEFDRLMNNIDNRQKMKIWAIEQIEIRGYKDLDKNKTIEDTFQSIATLLLNAAKMEELPSSDDIVDAAIKDNQLSEEQKKVLLHRLINRVNSQISNDSVKFNTSMTLEEFVSRIVENVQVPSTHEEAESIVRNNDLRVVNEVLDCNMSSLDRKSLYDALNSFIVKSLKKQLTGFQAENINEAFLELIEYQSKFNAVDKILKEYNVSDVSNLTDAIRDKQAEKLLKSVKNKIDELLPDKHLDTVQKLVNSLINTLEEAQTSKELIATEKEQISEVLEEKISMRDSHFVSPEDKNVIKLIEYYDELFVSREGSLTQENLELNKSLEKTSAEIVSLAERNKNLMSESFKYVDSLYSGIDRIMENCKTILNPCSDNDESQCVDIENRLFGELNTMASNFKAFHIDKEMTPVESRRLIQKLLVDELSKENSPINTICRYYAYSRLPFMTDTSREYGITFNRKNMSDLFDSIEILYVQFGINLNIPDLFVMGFEEGHFENLTGKTYGDLDNLCQNSRNHFDNIDSNIKPSNVIVDVVNVGYTVDGKVGRLTSVLTY